MALNHSLTLTLGCKSKKRPSGPIELELDLEAGNLVIIIFHRVRIKLPSKKTEKEITFWNS